MGREIRLLEVLNQLKNASARNRWGMEAGTAAALARMSYVTRLGAPVGQSPL